MKRDLTGKQVGRLTVLCKVADEGGKEEKWKCRCECGNELNVKYASLRSGTKKSCGCLKRDRLRENRLDVSGMKFNMLLAIKPTGELKKGKILWEWRCDCGKLVVHTINEAKHTKSCGCLKKVNLKHRLDASGQKFGSLTAIRPTNESRRACIIWEWECDCGKHVFFTLNEVKYSNYKSCGCMTLEARRKNIEKGRAIHNLENSSLAIAKGNLKLYSNNSSGVRGVSKAQNGKWEASIQFKKQKYRLGVFDTVDEAAIARGIAEKKLFGDFQAWYELNKDRINAQAQCRSGAEMAGIPDAGGKLRAVAQDERDAKACGSQRQSPHS
jgi:hypothetical protein